MPLTPETVADAWVLYSEHLQCEQSRILGITETAFFRYTMPAYGIEFESSRSQCLELAHQIPLADFVDVLNVQQKLFDRLGTKKYIQRSNRHRLKQLLDWCSSQDWWTVATRQNAHQYNPRRRNNLGNAHHVKLTERRMVTSYSLRTLKTDKVEGLLYKEKEFMDHELNRIEQEFEKLKRFLTCIQVYKRQDSAMRETTYVKVENILHLILGWLYFHEGKPLEELGLAVLDDIQIAYDYTDWLRTKRKASPETEIQALVALTHVAKFNYCKESNEDFCLSLSKSYVDIQIVSQLRKLTRFTNERVKAKSKPTADESKKWLDWPDFLACIEYLEKDCKHFTYDGQKRTDRAIAASIQRYLLAALLGYIPPDRQRTFRELEVGRTLIKGYIKSGILHPSEDGSWYIKLAPEDYKTGDTYGESVIQIPEFLYDKLKDWLSTWRTVLNPSHNFVFTNLRGSPLNSSSLNSLFRHAIYRASTVLFGEGKATNPHLVRDMIVTHCYKAGASEAEMEALALAMKHSRKTQREKYDRRNKQDKIRPALEMMQRFEPRNNVQTSGNKKSDYDA